MKKLSILIALLLCVTISGVYATWTYTNDQIDITDKYREVLVELEAAEGHGEKGTFEITTNLTLTVDQKDYDDQPNMHEAELIYGSSDGNEIYLTVTFTPSLNAGEDIRENAVPAELYFSTSTPMTCNVDDSGKFVKNGGTTKDIFLFSNKSDGVFNADPTNSEYDSTKAVNWGDPDSNGIFKVSYNEAQIKDMIKLNGTIILDTKEDHTEFKNNHLNGNVVINVTDGTVQSIPQG